MISRVGHKLFSLWTGKRIGVMSSCSVDRLGIRRQFRSSQRNSEPFDVVIIDHKMPKVSGIELVQRLRAANFGGKIIVLSAHLTDENRRAYAELNVDTLLTKPFDVHELREVVDSLAQTA